jgi:5'-deoxynucleotidase YfbR-like HD superfamily hydrolase
MHMSADEIPEKYRLADFFSHIDMGFLNRRIAISALGPIREFFLERQKPGEDRMTVLANDHLLVTMLIDVCSEMKAPTLAEALTLGKPRQLFMSIERLESCPEIYGAPRVKHAVHLDIDHGKPVNIAYHTSHLVSDTGRMTLSGGYREGYRHAMIGLLHDRGDSFEIEPIVVGSPWLDHPRNKEGAAAIWLGHDYGEILLEDIVEFARMKEVIVASADEWMSVMKKVPEVHVKKSIASLLKESAKSDWGGEENDHFSANVTVADRRCTAAFLLKGPTKFQEMTPAMCGKNGDQIYRLAKTGADISIVQHAHLIGAAVRETLRSMVVTPGRPRKFCVMDGQATYRLLKAYRLLPARVAKATG